MVQILVFGDSVTYGAWDLEGGWVQRLRKFLDKKVIDSNYESYFTVYNLGVDGDTSEGLLKRIENEIKPRVWPDEETIILIAIGSNDAIFNNETKKLKTSIEKYKENLQSILKIAKKYTSKVIFVGEAPIDGSRLDPMPWLPTHSFKSEHLDKVMQTAKEVCEESNIYFLEIQSKLNKQEFKRLLVDGAHPNSEGHEKIFEIVKNHFLKNKVIN